MHFDVIIWVLLKRMVQLKSFSLVPWYFYQHLDYIWRLHCCSWEDYTSLNAIFLLGFLNCGIFLQNQKYWHILKKNEAATVYNDLYYI